MIISLIKVFTMVERVELEILLEKKLRFNENYPGQKKCRSQLRAKADIKVYGSGICAK